MTDPTKPEPVTPEEEREFWEQAKDAQAEVDAWPKWKRRAADQALVTPKHERGVTPEEAPRHPLRRFETREEWQARQPTRTPEEAGATAEPKDWEKEHEISQQRSDDRYGYRLAEPPGEPQEAGAEDRTEPPPGYALVDQGGGFWAWEARVPDDTCASRAEAVAACRAHYDAHPAVAQLATVTRERDDWRRLLDEQSRLAEQHRLNHAFSAGNAERYRAERDAARAGWRRAVEERDALRRVCTEIAETTGYMHEGDGFAPQPCEPSQLPELMGRLRKERDEAHARGVAEGERLGAARALQEAADIWARSSGTLGLPDNRGVDGWLRFRASLVAADRAENAEGALSDYVRAAQERKETDE